MEHHIGICASCGARFKVPASFPHDRARCKTCKGVVHINKGNKPGPGSAAPPVPAKKVAPKPTGGSTLERLKAERSDAGGEKASDPGASSEKAGSRRSSGSARSSRSSRSSRGEESDGSSRRSSSRRRSVATKNSPHVTDEDGEDVEIKTRGYKQKSKAPAIIAGVLMVAAGVGLFLMKDQILGKTTAAQPDETLVVADAGPSGAEDTPEVAEDATDGLAAETPAEEVPVEEVSAPTKKRKRADPSTVDLSAIADYGRTFDTTEEEWAEMKALLVTWADPWAGAKGMRAGRALQEEGRRAFPLILNKLKSIDLSTAEGKDAGYLYQRALMDICNGTNFGWKDSIESEDVYYNKKVVVGWCRAWDQVEIDVNAFISMAKLDEKDPDEAARLREATGQVATPEVDEDDLDLD